MEACVARWGGSHLPLVTFANGAQRLLLPMTFKHELVGVGFCERLQVRPSGSQNYHYYYWTSNEHSHSTLLQRLLLPPAAALTLRGFLVSVFSFALAEWVEVMSQPFAYMHTVLKSYCPSAPAPR